MKILLDCVYTGKPSTCSTSYLMWKIIEAGIALSDDLFFYLLVPKSFVGNEVEEKFWSRHPDRVLPVPITAGHTDRMAELFRFSEELAINVMPGGNPLWDYDAILTSRIPQIPNMRVNTGRKQAWEKGSYQQIIGLEEMPVYSFRQTVSWGPGGEMDLASLAAYQMANAVVINNLWNKEKILQVARKFLAPSQVIALSGKIHEALPVKLDRLQLTAPKLKGKELTVAFCGRMTGTRNFTEVAEVFIKQYCFAKPGKKTRFVVSTNSQSSGSIGYGDISFVDTQYNDRAKFHALLKNEVDVVVNLSTVEDFSLSTYEPLSFGVPTIVPGRDWADFLGDDYPFRVANMVEAYAMLDSFREDYAKQYQRLIGWEEDYWKPMVEGPVNRSTASVVYPLLAKHRQKLLGYLQTHETGATFREVVKKIGAATAPGATVDLKAYAEDHELLIKKDNWAGVPVAKRPNLYLLKLLANLAGFTDTLKPGVVRKPVA